MFMVISMTYYLFNIDPIYKKINTDYELYAFLKNIYISKDHSLKKEIEYNHLVKRINKKNINEEIKKQFYGHYAYQYHHFEHIYLDRYKDESFNLIIGRSLLLLKSNHFNKDLFKTLSNFYFFACDFNNQNYFWTSEYSC